MPPSQKVDAGGEVRDKKRKAEARRGDGREKRRGGKVRKEEKSGEDNTGREE